MSFWELNIAYPNGGQWAPFGYVLPLPVAQTSSYATDSEARHSLLIVLTVRFVQEYVYLVGTHIA